MRCTDKEWQHCRVEKMGCTGCYYDEEIRYKEQRTMCQSEYIERNNDIFKYYCKRNR